MIGVTIEQSIVELQVQPSAGPQIVVAIAAAPVLQLQPVGIQGPPGPSGGRYLHTQASPSATWTINHNLGFTPSVAVYSVGGIEVAAQILVVSPNQVQVLFVTPTAGTATLS
jgi:hypothetical protein